jgi:hypothetical protein
VQNDLFNRVLVDDLLLIHLGYIFIVSRHGSQV